MTKEEVLKGKALLEDIEFLDKAKELVEDGLELEFSTERVVLKGSRGKRMSLRGKEYEEVCVFMKSIISKHIEELENELKEM